MDLYRERLVVSYKHFTLVRMILRHGNIYTIRYWREVTTQSALLLTIFYID